MIPLPPSPFSKKRKKKGEKNKTYMAIEAKYFNLVTTRLL
jgi:hypothetical protein